MKKKERNSKAAGKIVALNPKRPSPQMVLQAVLDEIKNEDFDSLLIFSMHPDGRVRIHTTHIATEELCFCKEMLGEEILDRLRSPK